MQRVQNRVLCHTVRDIDDRHKTMEQLHSMFGIEALNICLHNRMSKTWHRIQELDKELYDATAQANNDDTRDRNCRPREGRAYITDPPEPMYTSL